MKAKLMHQSPSGRVLYPMPCKGTVPVRVFRESDYDAAVEQMAKAMFQNARSTGVYPNTDWKDMRGWPLGKRYYSQARAALASIGLHATKERKAKS